MSDLIEIRWHGRGGQGAKTASLLLADAAFNTGKYIQGFPEYGPERMGAPITAYNRISTKPITIHSNIYEPDYVVVVDDTLLESVDVTSGLKKDGAIIINTTKSIEELAEEKGITEMSGVYIVDVEEKGGAKAAGIKEDDILLSVNNIAVNSNSQLIGVIGQYRPGDKVKVKIQRKGEVIDKEVTLKNLEGTEELHKEGESFYNEVLGIKARPLSSSSKSELGINYGLEIVEVKEGIFKQKGITDDFIILSVNYQKVSSENDLKKALRNDRNGKFRIEGTNSTGTYNITFEFYR